jgi:hypothetical protein
MDPKNFIIPQKVTSSLGIPNIINVIDNLPINPNYSWGELELIKNSVRTLEDITTIVLHHDAIPKSKSAHMSDMDLMVSIANTHIFIRNGMAYHTNDFRPLKFGVKANNHYTLHVCVSGDYHNYDTLTDPDRKMLLGVIIALKAELPCFKDIKAHKEIMPTQCPGYDYKKIRSDVTTAEMQLEFKETDNAQAALAFNIATRLLDLYDKAKGNGPYAAEAKRKLLLLEPFMKEQGLLS